MLGECVISSEMSCCNKDLKWQTSVTATLELRVLFSKQRIVYGTPLRREGTRTPKERPQLILAPSFFCVLSPPPPPPPPACPVPIRASQEGGVCVSTEVLTQIYGFFPFLGFSLCLLANAILDSFFLLFFPNYLTDVCIL